MIRANKKFHIYVINSMTTLHKRFSSCYQQVAQDHCVDIRETFLWKPLQKYEINHSKVILYGAYFLSFFLSFFLSLFICLFTSFSSLHLELRLVLKAMMVTQRENQPHSVISDTCIHFFVILPWLKIDSFYQVLHSHHI